MPTIKITGPDGRVARITAPDDATEAEVQAKIAEVKQNWPSAKPAQQPDNASWWQRNITGVRPKGEENTPAISDVEDIRSPSNFGSMLFGASDNQLADQLKTQLGDRFIRQETDENGYPIMVFKDQSGQERRGYVNKPGLDAQDVLRGGLGSLPYMGTGAAGVAAGAGRGLLANAALQGGAAAATSAAGDVAQIPLGSEQGIEGEKAAAAGIFGAAAPVAGRAIGNAYGYAKDKLSALPDDLSQFRRGAVNPVVEGMDADGLDPTKYAALRQSLGPEGMLADMGPNMQAQLAVIARTPGEGKTTALGRLNRRTEYAPTRMTQDVDGALGQGGNQRAYVEAQRKAYSQRAKPFYDQFHATAIPETGGIAQTINTIRQAMPSAFAEARKKAIADGIDPKFLTRLVDDPMGAITGTQQAQQGARVWSGAELDYLKRAVDAVANKARTEGDREGLRIWGGLAARLRGEVDTMLSPQNPADSPWAQARAIAGEGLEGEDALEMGSKVFTQKRDPFLVQDELSDLSSFGKDVYKRGARDDVRGIMGRAASAYGPKGDVAARRAFQGDFNRENLGIIADRADADNLLRRVDAETTFAETNDLAQRNSVTSTITGAAKAVPGANRAEVDFAAELGRKGPMGAATEAAARVVNALAGGALDRRSAALRADMAQMYTATGPERDRIVRALMDLRQGRAMTQEKAATIDRIVRALTIGATQPLAAASAD
jgi:hypothetical protein